MTAVLAREHLSDATQHLAIIDIGSNSIRLVVYDGLVRTPSGRTLGASALLMAESLLDIAQHGPLPAVAARARLLRIRHDDFRQVCSHDPHLAAALYMRLARHLAVAPPVVA